MKNAQEKLSQSCIFCPIAKDKDASRNKNASKKFFLTFTTICRIPAEWI